jgi:hypothetical protein
MSKINGRVTAFAAVMLSLGFAATGAAPALAQVGQISPRATMYRQIDNRLVHPAYAGPVPSSLGAASCDLPSSGCPDNERITS